MMKWAIPGVALLLLLVFFSAAYTVEEGTQIILTQFGRPVGEPVREPGLHFKTPFVQDVRVFEKRVLEWDGDPNQIPTRDKKFIEIDTTARWRITDPLRFLQTVHDESRAQARLDDILDAETRDAISSHDLIEAVRSSNRPMAADEEAEGGETVARDAIVSITVGRRRLAEGILEKASGEVEKFGIELVDFRIKQNNYVEEVRRKVYDRMVSERKRIAEHYRSEGLGKKSEIDGQREKELLRIRSEAYRRAEEIRGEAEAEAVRIYAEAYGEDAEFFRFVETLATYEKTLAGETVLVLSTDSPFLQYLRGP